MALYSRSNLKNLRLVMSVALEHIQANLTQFTKDATGNQLRQSDRSINQIRWTFLASEKRSTTPGNARPPRERSYQSHVLPGRNKNGHWHIAKRVAGGNDPGNTKIVGG